MTEKELHKLSREDLLRLLLAQSKEVSRLKAELETVKTGRNEAQETLERLKAKLDEKDAQLEKLKGRLDEKDAMLAAFQEEHPERVSLPAIRTEGMGSGLSTALDEINRKLDALSRQISEQDEGNRHLWTLLDSMMDNMEQDLQGERE